MIATFQSFIKMLLYPYWNFFSKMYSNLTVIYKIICQNSVFFPLTYSTCNNNLQNSIHKNIKIIVVFCILFNVQFPMINAKYLKTKLFVVRFDCFDTSRRYYLWCRDCRNNFKPSFVDFLVWENWYSCPLSLSNNNPVFNGPIYNRDPNNVM